MAQPTKDTDSDLAMPRRKARETLLEMPRSNLKSSLRSPNSNSKLLNQELTEATAELSDVLEQVKTLKDEGHDCHSESGCHHVHERDNLISQLEELQVQHNEVRDL